MKKINMRIYNDFFTWKRFFKYNEILGIIYMFKIIKYAEKRAIFKFPLAIIYINNP